MSVETEPFLTLLGWALPSIHQSWKCLGCVSVLGHSSPGQCSLCTLPSKPCKHRFFISLVLFPRHQTCAWPCSWSLPLLLIGFPWKPWKDEKTSEIMESNQADPSEALLLQYRCSVAPVVSLAVDTFSKVDMCNHYKHALFLCIHLVWCSAFTLPSKPAWLSVSVYEVP